jgi:MFS family permease
MTLVFAPLSGRIVGARGTRVPLLVAGVAMTTAGLMLTGLDTTTPVGWLIASYAVFGVGFAMVNPPITNTAVSGMPRAQAGVAAAIASTSRQVGSSLGVAVVGTVVAAGLGQGFVTASHVGWWIVAGCGLVVLVLGFASSGRWAASSAAAVRTSMSPAREPADVRA